MKKLSWSLIFVMVAIFSSFEGSAQNPIPSYHVNVNIGMTFEEATIGVLSAENLAFSPMRMLMEEKKMKVIITGNNPDELEWANVEVYSLDGSYSSGTLYVDEYNPLEISIGDNSYGVRILDKSNLCEMSVWTNVQDQY